MTNYPLQDLPPPANAVLTYIPPPLSKHAGNSHPGRVTTRHNVVPIHRKASQPVQNITTHISFNLSGIEEQMVSQFVQILLTDIRPSFSEFTLHFSQRLGGLNINIIPNNASEFSKQRLAVLNQAIKQIIQTLSNRSQNKKAFR